MGVFSEYVAVGNYLIFYTGTESLNIHCLSFDCELGYIYIRGALHNTASAVYAFIDNILESFLIKRITVYSTAYQCTENISLSLGGCGFVSCSLIHRAHSCG